MRRVLLKIEDEKTRSGKTKEGKLAGQLTLDPDRSFMLSPIAVDKAGGDMGGAAHRCELA
jgi:hypothetical protein